MKNLVAWWSELGSAELGWSLVFGVLAATSIVWGIVLLIRWRKTRSREQLLSGLIFTGVLPGVIFWIFFELIKVKFFTSLAPPAFEPPDQGISAMCYYKGGITIYLPPAFRHYRKRLVDRFRHRLPQELVARTERPVQADPRD